MPALLEDPARCRHAQPSRHLRALRRGPGVNDDDLRGAILARVAGLRAGTSLCPSQVARDLAEDWRPLMTPLRRVALEMAGQGRIAVTQKGRPAGPDPRGPIRLGRV
ncbi:DUF3253 domain-containing protein [Paracoccus aestuarii]|uniref:DUF3253 domain-containing protein n=1 Tax=Paracoccus aestuarii TaxID=453842 RepID=A0A419A091_9RHOB|nr:DUF3253 domain-containing protein [Paracoccus aestuarii]WCR00117.1 DUF3253 domain-containing protein [Paracoccus aestuarii]